MKVTITINCNNTAFDPEPAYEISRILKCICKKLEHPWKPTPHKLYDINGNHVGEFDTARD